MREGKKRKKIKEGGKVVRERCKKRGRGRKGNRRRGRRREKKG